MAKRSVEKIRKKYGTTAFQRWGEKGGSPILLSYKLHKPIKGYKVTHT
jgi:hypothetical protein